MFGVFILEGGKWSLWSEGFSGPRNAQDEADYLTKAFGLTAKVFRKL